MQQRGFTVIELMVTLAVAAIIVAVATPSFRAMLQNSRAMALSNSMVASINFARSEAIKRGANVSICAAANAGGTACGGAGDWANGWIVFVDTAGTGTLANQSDRLRLQEPLPNGATVASGSANLIFSNQGFLTSGGANLGLSASGCTGNHGRTINISASGKIDVSAAACP